MFLQIVRERVGQKIDSGSTAPRALRCGSSAFVRQEKIPHSVSLSSNQNKIHHQPPSLGLRCCRFIDANGPKISVPIPSGRHRRLFPRQLWALALGSGIPQTLRDALRRPREPPHAPGRCREMRHLGFHNYNLLPMLQVADTAREPETYCCCQVK